MKKILLAAMALGVFAVAPAKNADELRVYINPGHGSWTANDRPNPIVGHGEYSRTNTDTTNFFESNTNLRKGFGVLEMLRAYGLKYDPTLNQTNALPHRVGAALDMHNNIVMSHVKCGPYHEDNGTASQLGDKTPADQEYYNRSLYEISGEVDANNFDMFISIHSNAASEGTTTNFPLFLYRGYDQPVEHEGLDLNQQTQSRAMADACWGYAQENPHMMWTSYSQINKNLRGDCNFYAGAEMNDRGYFGYLGVLKHSVPGFLVEGYFHTYQPARHRAMNWDVDYMEGTAYAHGIADYFGLTKETTGHIYGIVRDANIRFVDKYYKANPTTLDRFKPLNGVVVILKKGDTEVARYTTDNYYNGAFVFKNVEPGTYTISFESEQYLAADPIEVEVKAASITYPTAQLVDKDWVPDEIVYTDYPDPMAGNAGIGAATQYNISAEYADEPIAELEGLTVKRTFVRNGKMYILALDKPVEFAAVVAADQQAKATILVYDLANKQVVAKVSTEGAAGSIAAIADMQLSADGVLLACNATKTQFDDSQIQEGDAGRGTFVIYKWENDENGLPAGNPVPFISTTNSGLWYRAYPSQFVYSGTLTEGKALITMPTITGPAYNLRGTMIAVAEGEAQTPLDIKPSPNVAFGTRGADFNMVPSPVDENGLLVLDSELGMQAWGFATVNSGAIVGNEAAALAGGRSGVFKYAGASFVVYPKFEGETCTGLEMVNISGNVDKASTVTLSVSAPEAQAEAAATTYAAAAGETVVTRDAATDAVTDGWIELYLLRDGKVSKFTTHNVQQPQGRKEYAYDVKSVESDDSYAITFSMTGDAPEASLRLTATDGSATLTLPIGAVTKGENNFTVNKSDLNEELEYAWEVVVVSDPIAQAGLYSKDVNGLSATRGGVVPLDNPEYESFGYVVVGHGRNQGIDVYNPAGEKVASRIFKGHAMFGGASNTNQSDPFRGNELQGKAVLATWGDNGYGAVVIDPLDTQAEPFSLFSGTKDKSGCFITDEGTLLGGGNSGLDFLTDEKGDNWMIMFSEDHNNTNGGGGNDNSITRSHLSGPWTITEAPTVLGYKGLMANTNVDVTSYGTGAFVSQVRGAGNNAAGTPVFAYISNLLNDEDIVEMTSADDAIVDYINSGTSGFAITADGKTAVTSTETGIVVLNVEWQGTKPVMTYRYTFPIDTNDWATMRFDAAGNLHVYLRQDGYRIYTLRDEHPEAATPAASKYNFKGAKGVESIEISDAAQADAVFYNLQGIMVPAENLTPGIYVKVAGNKATKVIVK